MSSNYDDDTEALAVCQEERATMCRHVTCLSANIHACYHAGTPEGVVPATTAGYRCLLPVGHRGYWHENGPYKWSTCRRHPGCDCPRHTAGTIKPADPHVCPEILVISSELVRELEVIVDQLDGGTNGKTPYDILRLILDKMEKGFKTP